MKNYSCHLPESNIKSEAGNRVKSVLNSENSLQEQQKYDIVSPVKDKCPIRAYNDNSGESQRTSAEGVQWVQ